jgi:very-short-patch-repair endonuclease
MSLPRPLLDIAERQFASFNVDQARSVGVTRDMLYRRRRTGELDSPHPCVYTIAGAPRSLEQTFMTACLAGGRDAVVSDAAALQVWDLFDFDDPPTVISIPRLRSPRFTRGTVTVHRRLDLRPSHTTVRRGLPVTNPLRTMVDAAGTVDGDVLQDALDAGIGQKLFTVKAVDAMRARLAKPGRTGTGRLRELLDSQVIIDQDRSVLEARMARLWRRFGLPPYEFQHTIRDAKQRFVARPDFTIVPPKVIVEVDGWRRHSSPTAVDADGRRENKLLALGWLVVHFSWWRVKNEPAAVAEEILSIVSARIAV